MNKPPCDGCITLAICKSRKYNICCSLLYDYLVINESSPFINDTKKLNELQHIYGRVVDVVETMMVNGTREKVVWWYE